jgi:hypothetical protein
MPTLVLNTTAQTQDTRIVSNGPTLNFSADAALYLGENGASNPVRILCKFLDLLPPGGFVTVSAATLSLTSPDNQASTRGVQVRKLLQPFVYATTSWNNRDTGTPWNVAGVLGGTDVDATVLATGTAPTTAGIFTMTGAGLIAYCQSVMNGGVDHGLIVNCLDDATVSDGLHRRIRKSSFGTAANRPTLTIEYTTGGPPPNWTVSNPTVNSDAGTATVVLTLDAPAPAGGVNGFFSTYDITATAGNDYTQRTGVAITIAEGGTTANLTVPILP